ncbi:hypothetical protein D3C71_1436030 [compost metagenome]
MVDVGINGAKLFDLHAAPHTAHEILIAVATGIVADAGAQQLPDFHARSAQAVRFTPFLRVGTRLAPQRYAHAKLGQLARHFARGQRKIDPPTGDGAGRHFRIDRAVFVRGLRHG